MREDLSFSLAFIQNRYNAKNTFITLIWKTEKGENKGFFAFHAPENILNLAVQCIFSLKITHLGDCFIFAQRRRDFACSTPAKNLRVSAPLREKKRRLIFDRINRITYHLSLITYHLPPKRPLRLCARIKTAYFLDRINRITYHLLLITYHLAPCASAREKKQRGFLPLTK